MGCDRIRNRCGRRPARVERRINVEREAAVRTYAFDFGQILDLRLQLLADVVGFFELHALREDDVDLDEIRRAEVECAYGVDLEDQWRMMVGQPLKEGMKTSDGPRWETHCDLREKLRVSGVATESFDLTLEEIVFEENEEGMSLTVGLPNPGDDDVDRDENGTDRIDEDRSLIDPVLVRE